MNWLEIIAGILIAMLTDEILGWVDRLSSWIVRDAARRLSNEVSKRLEEEWQADLACRPGKLSRLFFALDCYRAVYVISGELISQNIKYQRRGSIRCSICRLFVRTFDLLGSLGLIILSGPVFFITAIAIRFSSKGPVLVAENRVGFRGCLFRVYRFRTTIEEPADLVDDACKMATSESMTSIGRVIRRLYIDEIPMLLNVLRGDLSFVGPHPESPRAVNEMREQIPYYDLRFLVKPGITGWAQVAYKFGGRDKEAVEKLQYDLYFIKHYSIIFIMQILLESFKLVILEPHESLNQ